MSYSSSTLILVIAIFLLLLVQNASSTGDDRFLLQLKKTHGRHLRAVSTAASAPKKVGFESNVALTVPVQVGVPPQNVTMVFSTGSGLSWLHCNKAPMLASVFDPKASKSYLPVDCNDDQCKVQTQDLAVPGSCEPKTKFCHVAVSYADGSEMEGTLATEEFKIGNWRSSGFNFGCMKVTSTTTAAEEESETTGIMAMNLGSLSFARQMFLSKFSYCISSTDSTGVLLFGEGSHPWLKGVTYTPLVKRTDRLPSFDRFAYSVQLEGIKVGTQNLIVPKTAFQLDHTGGGQTMIDTSTQFTFFIEPIYTALKNEFVKQSKGALKVYEDYVFQGALDLCFLVPKSNKGTFAELPGVTLMFQGGAELKVWGKRLLYKVPKKKGDDLVHCFTFGNSALLNVEQNIIGNYHQKNVWMEFDLAQSRVGFAEIVCDAAGKKLGL